MANFPFGRNRRGGRGTNQYSVKPSTASSVDVDRLHSFPRSLSTPSTTTTDAPDARLEEAVAAIRANPDAPAPGWLPDGVVVAARESSGVAASKVLDDVLDRSPGIQRDMVAASLRREDLVDRLQSVSDQVRTANDAIMRDVGW